MKTTASMRKRINSLLEELGEGWSEGDPFEGRNGHPTIPMAYQGKLVGNLAFPNYGTLRYIYGVHAGESRTSIRNQPSTSPACSAAPQESHQTKIRRKPQVIPHRRRRPDGKNQRNV